jgi:hypothetical protein
MKNRSRPFDCTIANKVVGITLRHGGGLQEPDRVYIRCDERDCQYVDLNQPPCPLKLEMFADGSDERVADFLGDRPGMRFCYACVTTTLEISHDQVRRASWRLKEDPGFSIRPSRCAGCNRRRVTVALEGDGLGRTAASAEPLEEASTQALSEYLRERAGFALCAHCLARELGTRPAAIRDAMWKLEVQPTFHIRTGQCVSCLLTKPSIRYEEAVTDLHAPRRVLDFLLQSAGRAFCATCVAFSTELGLADVRRVFQGLESAPVIRQGSGDCEACGRWQTVTRVVIQGEGHAERVAEVGEVLSGHVRYRGCRVDLLSFRSSGGWRPLALVRSGVGALVPDAPAILLGMMGTKIEADELAAAEARGWINKRFP